MLEQKIIENVGNPDFDVLFADTTFRKGRKIVDPILEELYNGIHVTTPTVGSVVKAKYVAMNEDHFILSVDGYKDNIRIDNKPGEAKYMKNTACGEEIDIVIQSVHQDHYYIKGSLQGLYESRAHASLMALDDSQPVMAFVKSMNPSGYEMEVYNNGVTLAGFMPNTLAGINRLHNPESIVGKKFEVMIESFSEHEGTYIVNRRKYLQSLVPSALEELYHNTLYTGHVTGTTNYGVFVEFNECLTGMIHKGNLTPEWVDRISEIKAGTLIEFFIKEVVRHKIVLTQVLRETVWDTIEVGKALKGTVFATKSFGVLVRLDEETIGLIPDSEKSKFGELVEKQEVDVVVASYDRDSRKITLSNK